jgi:outer membrane protein OmpU
MNKLSKLGVSALCGSLAAISAANAGDLTATGGATVTWLSEEGAVTGNPIGMASAVSFTGSGELDNGWNVKLSIAGNDAGAYSASSITITLPGMGDVLIDQGASGTGIARYDDATPSVYEEADGAGISAGIDKVLGVNSGATIEITPTEAMPDGLIAHFAYSKDADSGNTSDKTAGGASNELGSGWDITLEAGSDLTGVDGLTLYAGMSEYEQYQNSASHNGDGSERVYGMKYASGGFTVGLQRSDEETGETAVTDYQNTMYSVTFNVNDDLSIGYNHVESDKSSSAAHADAEADSLQAAYTMGGATISVAEVDIENRAYGTSGAADVQGTVVSLGLAF